MKKAFIILGVFILGGIATILAPSAAYAQGESFEFTSASSGSGYGGSEIIASGGAFQTPTTFKLVTKATAQRYTAVLNGYSAYYKADSFNLKTAAAELAPACKSDPVFIALKSPEANSGYLYPATTYSAGAATNCFGIIGTVLEDMNADPDNGYTLTNSVSIKPDSVWVSLLDGYVAALAGPLAPLKTEYYGSLVNPPCSSQGCNDTVWNASVGLCWHSARTSAADTARLSGQAQIAYDIAQGTRENFASCMAGKVNGVATSAEILQLISNLDVGAVNQSGGSASQDARDEQEAALAPTPEEAGSSSCVLEGVGWFVCPFTNLIANISDGAFSVIENFLKVDINLFKSDSGTETAWSAFRNIANVAFVIVFMIIIYSQLTGQGVTNYGVKKTLPRLIVAAVLVNVSYLICQLAVDVTQVLGASLKDLLTSIPVASASETMTWSSVITDVLAGTGIVLVLGAAAVGGGAVLALSISLPVLIAAALAILMTVIILIGRQAGIVILIVLSPLAFVAYMLPNTEKWFKKWFKVFLALLMVYPIIALLYGGGDLASKIMSSAANSTEGAMKFWLGLTAVAVASLPLIMTPALLKGAMNATGTIGAKLSGAASKANARVKGAANTSSRYGEAKQGIKNRFAMGRARRRTNSVNQAVDNSRLGRALGLDRGAARSAEVVKAEELKDTAAEQKRYEDVLIKMPESDREAYAKREFSAAVKSGNATRVKAILNNQFKTAGGRTAARAMLAEAESDAGFSKKGLVSVKSHLENEHSSIDAQDNVIAEWSHGKGSIADITARAGTYEMNDQKLAGHALTSLMDAHANNQLDGARAARILANPNLSGSIKEKERAFLQSLAGTVSTGTGGGAGGASSSGTATSAASLIIPRNNGAPAAGGAGAGAAPAAAGTPPTTGGASSGPATLVIPRGNSGAGSGPTNTGGTPPTTP